MTRVGENTIKATFEGNKNYNEATTTITVEVKPLKALIILDNIDPVMKGDKAIISGKITDENGKAIANAQVKILINGSPKTLKADTNGVFTYNYTMSKLGTNNITVTYAGSTNYEETNTTTTVEISKKRAVITLNPIKSVNQKENITITGKITDNDGNFISGAHVRITINNRPKTLTADASGVFTHTYTMSKEGTNNITAIFNGNNNYEATNTTMTVEVIKI